MFFVDDRRLDARARVSRSCDLRLQDLAEVDLGDAHVAVRVALDIVELREIFRRDVEHDAFGDHRHAVAPPVAQPLDDARRPACRRSS